MMGLMQCLPLTIGSVIDHAERNHNDTEVVSRGTEGTLERSTWGRVAQRSRRVAAALESLGAKPGDRIASLAWNRLPHLELYYGVPGGGYVLHTLNPRLFEEQIRFVLADGGARILFVDPDLLPLAEGVLAIHDAPVTVVVLCERKDLPESPLADIVAYEDLLAAAEPLAAWPDIDERSAAGLCYTSGTTGNPKGVLYSHRSTVLHAMSLCSADSMALSARDHALLLPPMFHVNSWGVPYASAMCGAKLVLPGSALDGASLHALIRDEEITFSLGVPTVWFTILDRIEATTTAEERAALKLDRVFMGGAATPRALVQRFRDLLGVETMQAWGMTETSPVVAVCRTAARHRDLSPEAHLDLRAKAGRCLFGSEIGIGAEDGSVTGPGGDNVGPLLVRGHWVASGYFGKEPGSALDAGGWFDSGDIARIDGDGFIQITDRAKDVIKSGGEWISSIELENVAVAHPAVREAAVIGVPHPRWQERPLLLLCLHEGASVSRAEMLAHLADHVARWWLPDDVVCVDELPHTGSGKVMKAELRHQFRSHLEQAG
ncbi:long-chain fatty acid--CoA ligase [Novosphingobium aerophilum]|uniref:long-chain fatty acid--CoA ligase n=1 Tax=Novosphingobium TaxID=165696 RepID=UPI0012C534AC|nr:MULTISPECIES: long-chain fatty acid--CoA ligase [unclassified Novosphingobium]MPS68361.1 fatty-acid--CoA ligase [Novosphingobium sp.]WRT95596.1 long-chain fatty acid--CoA ligase [Novosphingobium sp. RL4]